jgi:glyoxylate reductase
MKGKLYKVLVTRLIPEAGIALLQDKCDLDIYRGEGAIPRDQLLQKISHVQGLFCLLSESVDRELLDNAPQLKVVSNYAVGYDNIDVNYATYKGVAVTNTPDVLTDATADLTWALILAAARQVTEGDRLIRDRGFSGWSPLFMLGQDLKGKILGVLGAGRIGTAVVERSRGWNMPVLYYDHHRREYLEKNFGANRTELSDLLAESDIISVHLPLSHETFHLIDEKAILKMKTTAILVNTARGPIVDERALLQALQRRRIAAAGLDVYENEPKLIPGLAALDNVVVTPHIGSATVKTRNDMARIAASNLLAVLDGRKPEAIINPEVFNQKI